jgi:hypothetical protein
MTLIAVGAGMFWERKRDAHMNGLDAVRLPAG